jgi:hypothetical protein
VWATSGWNCTARRMPALVAHHAKGAFSDMAAW